MRRLFLFWLAVLPFMTGCGEAYVVINTKYPSGLVDQQTLDLLIGEEKQTVLLALGLPRTALVSKTSSYFLYGDIAPGHELGLAGGVLPFGYGSTGFASVICILLEFDEESVFRRYQIAQHIRGKSEISCVSDCGLSFFTLNELESFMKKDVEVDAFKMKLYLEREKVLQEKADRGDPNSGFELYKIRKYHGEYDFKRLCTLAEQGDYRAQWELGYLHANGLYGVRKDLVLSAMWYGLVKSAGHNPGGFDSIRERLTPAQRIEAEHLYESWKPGQCEHEIFGSEQNSNK